MKKLVGKDLLEGLVKITLIINILYSQDVSFAVTDRERFIAVQPRRNAKYWCKCRRSLIKSWLIRNQMSVLYQKKYLASLLKPFPFLSLMKLIIP